MGGQALQFVLAALVIGYLVYDWRREIANVPWGRVLRTTVAGIRSAFIALATAAVLLILLYVIVGERPFF